MMRLLLALAIGLTMMLPATDGDDGARAGNGTLRPFTKISTVPQNNGSFEANGAPITKPGKPFAFARVGRIRRLEKLAITATINDGSTGADNFDRNNLHLALDGIDTGILLNGFDSGETVTQTNSGALQNARKILAALKEDGTLAATILDVTPDDTNALGLTSDDTTLVLRGKQRDRR